MSSSRSSPTLSSSEEIIGNSDYNAEENGSQMALDTSATSPQMAKDADNSTHTPPIVQPEVPSPPPGHFTIRTTNSAQNPRMSCDRFVREDLVTGRSPFFAAALKGDTCFIEGEDKLVDFTNEDPDTVHQYIDLLEGSRDELRPRWAHLNGDEGLSIVVNLYILAEFLMDEEIRMDMLQEMGIVTNHPNYSGGVSVRPASAPQVIPSVELIRYIYQHTSPHSGDRARQFLVDLFTHTANQENAKEILTTAADDLPVEFTAALMRALIQERQPIDEHIAEVNQHTAEVEQHKSSMAGQKRDFKSKIRGLRKGVRHAHHKIVSEQMSAEKEHEKLKRQRRKVHDKNATIKKMAAKMKRMEDALAELRKKGNDEGSSGVSGDSLEDSLDDTAFNSSDDTSDEASNDPP